MKATRMNRYSLNLIHKSFMGMALSAVLIFIVSCTNSESPKPPKELLDESTYIDLLIEFQLVDSYYNRYTSRQDTLPDPSVMKQEILQKYDITWERFKKSHDHYKQHPEAQRQRIEKAIEEIRKKALTPIIEDHGRKR